MGTPGLKPLVAAADDHGAAEQIHRATTSDVARDGHFSDPYPLFGSFTAGGPPDLTFSGTFNEIITCHSPVKPGCFQSSEIHTGFSPALKRTFAAHGDEVHSTKAHHLYQRPDGTWDMIFTSEIAHGTSSWNLIFHAHAADVKAGAVPTHWEGDALLSGSLSKKTAANYDGKLYDDHGHLYLIYSGAISTRPQTFAVVAQPLISPSRVADKHAVTLLAPSTRNGGLASENRFGIQQTGQFKLTETGNIFTINGKYVMVYAVGAFDRPDYKIGVAYSDTFLPGKQGYRKVLMTDDKGVWGDPGQREVRYVLQSQVRDWPNYVRSAVQAPGVGSLIRSDDRWYMFFAGYDPREQAIDGKFAAAHRQPYFLPVRVNIPRHLSVRHVSNAKLQSWLTLD